MALISINTGGGSGFLYNNSSGPARLCITAETQDFDNELLRNWQDEGFDVVYLSYDEGGKDYASRLRGVKEGLGVGENYAIIAFGDAASFCLDYYLKPTNASRLCALVAYYPTNIPDTRSRFSPQLRVLVHLAGSTVDVTTIPTALGLQGKKRRKTRQITPGIGTGERLYLGYLAYTYEYVQPGFAEHDLDEYDRLASELAWSRTLHTLRKAFNRDMDLEKKWEEHVEGKFFSSNLSDTMEPFAHHVTPVTTYTPTLSGGIGSSAIRRFYERHFLRQLPPSMRLRLISRTIGAADRIVDEVHLTFNHTHELPWMLPGVAPTNRKVEIVVVTIAAMKAGKLASEHVYWDQASVLVQVGLLDPNLVPPGVHRLPVVGTEAARRILREDPPREEEFQYHNRLIRRAAKHAKGKSSVEMSEVDRPGPVTDGKGKKVLRDEPRSGNGNGTGEMGEEVVDEEDDGNAVENEQKENGRTASVEDDGGSDEDDGGEGVNVGNGQK